MKPTLKNLYIFEHSENAKSEFLSKSWWIHREKEIICKEPIPLSLTENAVILTVPRGLDVVVVAIEEGPDGEEEAE